jgi:hypothetical protein
MDMNAYTLQVLARDRLVELRAAGERSSRVRALRRSPRPLRAAVGQALVRVGHRLQSERASSQRVRHG